MISLVTHMLELHKQLHAAREIYQRQTAVLSRCFSIDATDQAIDALARSVSCMG